MEFNNRIRYTEETCKLALNLINNGFAMEEISRKLNIPATTIRNWKLGYIKVYGKNKKLDSKNKVKIHNLVNLGYRINEIAKTLDMSYDTVGYF